MSLNRLVLFDIDGTLISTQRSIWKDPFKETLEDLFREVGRPREIDTSRYRQGGKTDPQIIFDILGQNGVAEAEVEELFPRIRSSYLARLKDTFVRHWGITLDVPEAGRLA